MQTIYEVRFTNNACDESHEDFCIGTFSNPIEADRFKEIVHMDRQISSARNNQWHPNAEYYVTQKLLFNNADQKLKFDIKRNELNKAQNVLIEKERNIIFSSQVLTGDKKTEMLKNVWVKYPEITDRQVINAMNKALEPQVAGR